MVFDLAPKATTNFFLAENISALADNNFGLYDFFWFLQKKDSYSFEEIVHWMRSLYYSNTEEEITDHYGVATLKSTADPEFALKVYVKSEPLPQEAIDVIPIFIGDGGEKYAVLATKRKAKTVRVTLLDAVEVEVLTIGKHGKTLMGEHLEEGEKKRMDEIRATFQANGEQPFGISQKDVSSVTRTCFEEGGFTLRPGACNILYVHTDNAPARDDRYWTYYSKRGEIFGYTRDSTSDTVVVLMHGSVPEKMPEPNDLAECETPVILKVEDIFQLLEKKQISFAFAAHMAQLSIAAFHSQLPIVDEFATWVGKKIVDLPRDATLRVVMVDGKPVRRDFDFDRRRLNISLDAKGAVVRVLGYF
jgi:hypothetical protein